MIRVLPFAQYTGCQNMAIDHYFYNSDQTILRFYGWNPYCLSFGKSNSDLKHINLDYCTSQNIETVVRMTGGKTVYHHNEFTYSFCSHGNLFPSSVIETYKIISSIIITSLKELGILADMKEEKEMDKITNICFKEKSSYEVTVNNKKLIGSAQKRSKNRVLQHGSIPIDIDFDAWSKIWKLADIAILKKRITSLNQELQSSFDINTFQKYLITNFSAHFNLDYKIIPLSKFELSEIKKLESKFNLT